MPRFFVTRSQVAGDEIVIRGNDVNHIKNVLRMHPGDELSISDGQGTDYFCRIKTMEREEIGLSIENFMEFLCGTSGPSLSVSGTAEK